MQTMNLRISVTLMSILILVLLSALAIDSSLAAVAYAAARQCYVCGEGADAPFRAARTKIEEEHPRHTIPTVPNITTTCEDFNRNVNERDKYVIECPPEYTSCLTQVDADIEVRTCGESLPINDCKSANGIDYCYCIDDLCNNLNRSHIRQRIEESQAGRQKHNSDDEDLTESSGMEDPLGKYQPISSSSNRMNQNRHSNRDFETTQVAMTLEPLFDSDAGQLPGLSSEGGNSSAKSGSSSRWLVGLGGSAGRGWVALVLIGASMWRFASSI